jgi:uncharacterized protein (TIGR02001 family)
MRAALWLGTAFAALSLAGSPAAAQDADPVTFSGVAALTSNYTFRGISQTQNEAAIQGGINMTGPKIVYAGIWGSSVNFGEAATLVTSAQGAQAEVDGIVGIRPAVGPFGLDLGVVYYAYPGSAESLNYNFLEVGLGLSKAFTNFTIGPKVAWSPDFFAGSGTGLYFGGSLAVPIPSTTLSLTGSVGHQSIETNSAFGTPDYLDWTAGATLGFKGLTFGAVAVGTDLSEGDCFGGTEFCKAQVIFSISK